MSIVLQSSGGGQITLLEPTTASNFTQTLPAATGTVMVSGNMPAFSASQNVSTSLTNNVATKILFGTESFDTNNNFASSTFTPTVAGFYQINAKVAFSVNGTNTRFVALFKNGSKVTDIAVGTVNGTNSAEVGGSFLISMNGSTDFLEIFAFQNSGSTLTTDGGSNTYFQASMVRAA